MLQVSDKVRFKDISLLPYYGYMVVEVVRGSSVKLSGLIGLYPICNVVKE